MLFSIKMGSEMRFEVWNLPAKSLSEWVLSLWVAATSSHCALCSAKESVGPGQEN